MTAEVFGVILMGLDVLVVFMAIYLLIREYFR